MNRRRVLITGANKGIGKATVAAVLSAGEGTAVLLGSRDEGRGQAARDRLLAGEPSWADRLAVVALDVGDDDSVERAAARVAADFGDDGSALYGIVNNAGIGLPQGDLRTVLNVNTYGPKRVCDHFLPLLQPSGGRIVNVSSASGPNFVSRCSAERQRLFTDPEVTWDQIDALMVQCQALADDDGDFAGAGLGDGAPYGLSKACLNAYTVALARSHPELRVNCCTPGFIETDLTRHYAQGRSARDVGMKSPAEGTRATLHLLFADPIASGWYFGSDAERSPLDRYRSPGDPPYAGN